MRDRDADFFIIQWREVPGYGPWSRWAGPFDTRKDAQRFLDEMDETTCPVEAEFRIVPRKHLSGDMVRIVGWD